MLQHEEHPSDDTFLLAIDGELLPGPKRTFDQHLLCCEDCRSRMQCVESMADETSAIHRSGLSARIADTDVLRERLQAGMTALADTWDRSWWFGLRMGIATLPPVVRVGASVAVVALVLQFVRLERDTALPTNTLAPIETEALPVRGLTPGATSGVGREDLCASRPAKSAIPASTRQAVLRQYQMEHVAEHEYELDYLITPELGGVADQRNLWPERYASGAWNALVKDDLERLLPQMVCRGTIDLATAQQDIAVNWIAAYKKYFGTDRPMPRQARVFDDDDDDDDDDNPEVARSAAAVSHGAPATQFVLLRVSLSERVGLGRAYSSYNGWHLLTHRHDVARP